MLILCTTRREPQVGSAAVRDVLRHEMEVYAISAGEGRCNDTKRRGTDQRTAHPGRAEARAAIYPDVTTREQFFSFVPRMSLVARALLERPSAPMLLVNGARDTQVPIDDLYLLMNHGTPKEAWANPVGGHMGRSAEFTSPMIARAVVLPWIARALRGEVPMPKPKQ